MWNNFTRRRTIRLSSSSIIKLIFFSITSYLERVHRMFKYRIHGNYILQQQLKKLNPFCINGKLVRYNTTLLVNVVYFTCQLADSVFTKQIRLRLGIHFCNLAPKSISLIKAINESYAFTTLLIFYLPQYRHFRVNQLRKLAGDIPHSAGEIICQLFPTSNVPGGFFAICHLKCSVTRNRC